MRYRKPFVRTITVKYAGECRCCGATIKAGELADYYPNMRAIAHIGGLDGTSARCSENLRARHDRDFADVDRAYEDQCAEICGR